MEVDISQENEEPFNTQVTTTNLDLASSLEALNFLGSESLRDADQIDGTLELKVDFAGSLQDLKLITGKNKGVIDFELHDLKLKGLNVLDRISKKLFSPGLFSELSFAPLINVLQINGSRLEIPQMEVQTDEVDFFMEGHLDNNNNTNIWLSIPLDNIKRKNKASLEPRDYEDTKRKFYFELKPDEKGKLQSKFRFRKKKFYTQRGLDWKENK